jgi:hypothetical protein
MAGMEELVSGQTAKGTKEKGKKKVGFASTLTEPDWMGEPELR